MSKQRECPLFRLPIECHNSCKTVDKDTVRELELVEGENPIYPTLLKMSDDYRKLTAERIASNYSDDPMFLTHTQELIKNIGNGAIHGSSNYEEIMELRNDIKVETGFIEKYGFVDWEYLKFLNENPLFLQLLSVYEISSPVLSLALPVLLLIIPFFVLRVQGHSITISSYTTALQSVLSRHTIGQLFSFNDASWDRKVYIILSFVFYIAQIYYNFESCKKFISNFKAIHTKLDSLRTYLSSSRSRIQETLSLTSGFDSYSDFNDDLQQVVEHIDNLLERLSKISSYKLAIGKIGEVGEIMKVFYQLYNTDWVTGTLEYAIQFNSYLDNLTAVAEREEEGKMNKCKLHGKKTKLKRAFYPSHIDDGPVPNDVDLSKNLIITGPNASGKTTMLKTTFINVLLSQQFGYGCYSSATVRPYVTLSCYINIPDTSGRDSLFQAEARRCIEILRQCEGESDGRVLCIFDELFSGTNPYEAIGAATAFLEKLNRNKRVEYLITTHFLDVCKNVGESKRASNLQMKSKMSSGGVNYSYQLVDGVSSVKGGIAVLRQLEYPSDIVSRSLQVIEGLSL
jgi:hypothetical protein